jgi:hypothetical protein
MKKKVIIKREKTGNVNGPIWEICKSYYKISTPNELGVDWLVPLTASLISFIILGLFSSTNTGFYKSVISITTTAINVMAILAGFNTASLAIIASTNKNVLKLLNMANKKNPSPKYNQEENISLFKRIKYVIFGTEKENILKITIIFFSYAIILQILILILGSILVVFSDNLADINRNLDLFESNYIRIIITIVGCIWFTIILHSLFVTLRNVSLIYRYILFLGKEDDKEQNRN